MSRKFLGTVAAVFMTLFVTFGFTQTAFAHSDTFQSVPANGSTVSTPVIEIQFTFVEPVNAELSPPEVALVNSDGVPAQLGTPTLDVTGGVLTASITSGALPNGSFTASYRIVSEDGHPASGSFSFSVEGSDADPLSEAVIVEEVPVVEEPVVAEVDEKLMAYSSDGDTENTQLQLVLGLSAAGAVALAAVLVIVALRRRRNSSSK